MIGGIILVAVTEWLWPATGHLVRRIVGKEQHGLSIDVEEPTASAWVFGGKTYGDLAPPPAQVEYDRLDSWATENGATAVSQRLSFILRGKSDKTVVVKQLEPKVNCGPSTAGVPIYDDRVPTSMIPHSSTVLEADASPVEIAFKSRDGKQIKSPKYQVTQSDKESVTLSVHATSHRCTWSVVVHWSVDGKDRTTKIPNRGQYVVTGSNAATQHWKVHGELFSD
ncbi:hypothetical protein [Streptomyces sp. NPDC006463]|uniref:hypothetical protein n=1 Tax=Streptomyces sp. NPDC006463 TaxID=3364746 RepID=UPI0036CCE5E8